MKKSTSSAPFATRSFNFALKKRTKTFADRMFDRELLSSLRKVGKRESYKAHEHTKQLTYMIQVQILTRFDFFIFQLLSIFFHQYFSKCCEQFFVNIFSSTILGVLPHFSLTFFKIVANIFSCQHFWKFADIFLINIFLEVLPTFFCQYFLKVLQTFFSQYFFENVANIFSSTFL
jgi:hypothetical protein